MINLPISSKAWQEQWAYERWVCQQRLALLDVLLGGSSYEPETEHAWEELVKWIRERVAARRVGAGPAESTDAQLRAELEAHAEVVKKILKDRWELYKRGEELTSGLDQLTRERDQLQAALKERQADFVVEAQENLRLKQWVARPVEELGRSLQERDETLRVWRARFEKLERALHESRVAEEGAREKSQEKDRLIQWLEIQRQQDRAFWEKQVAEERERWQKLEEERSGLWRRRSDDQLAWQAERDDLHRAHQALAERLVNEQRERERERERQRTRLARFVGRMRERFRRWRTRPVPAPTVIEVSPMTEGHLRHRELAQREILFGMSNQMRNALGIIRSSGQLLGEQVGRRPKAQELVQAVIGTADQLERTVERIMGTVNLRLTPLEAVPLSRVVTEARTAVEEVARHHQVTIVIEGVDGLPPVAGQASWIKQALMAMMLNSVEAMPGGGRLIVRGREDGREVEVEVADTGVGVEAVHHDEVIVPGYTTKPDHTGLGMTFVARVMTLMSGEVRIESNEPAGLRVMLRFLKWTPPTG